MPTMWEFVLAADAGEDLADPGRGRVWCHSGRFWGLQTLPAHVRERFTGEGAPDWPVSVCRMWEDGVRAFRSVVGRVKVVKTRKPGVTDAAADAVFKGYVGRLIVRVDAFDDPTGALGRARIAPGLRLDSRDDWHQVLELRVSEFFQKLFLSLLTITPTPAPVCGRCGRDLNPTAKGRPPRAKHCKSCRHYLWNHRRKQADRQAAWRLDQRNKRRRDKKNSGHTKGD